MSSDLRRRLERLERRPGRSPALAKSERQDLPEGEELKTPQGSAFRIETTFPADHVHGRGSLGRVLDHDPTLAAEVAGDEALEKARIRRWSYVDLETTGLSGGAGTLSFLIGVGTFVGDKFRLRQYFLRDPDEEPAALHLLRQDLEASEGFVTFNGRSFDLPVLETRYTLATRDRWRLSNWPHLDLLYPSRRLWRSTLTNCRLPTLEAHILQVERTDEDVPGEMIPGMYLDYLRSGDASQMRRVIYHNEIDILSLVGLSSVVLDRHVEPDLSGLSTAEALAIARWHQTAGRQAEAEAGYRAALAGKGDNGLRAEGQRRLTTLLKRQDRRGEAIANWKEWNQLAPDDPAPCIELAMYYEWHAKDLSRAHSWAQEGLMSVSHWPAGWQRDRARAQIEHRLARLERKLQAGR